ncbi:hypothetical protein [Aquamicrobium zhengzhouense]|uniref:Uncharacterized protein n=1 Tax=Aquamicrobium zhengzhouense TaxID=2781738 RepID=A0ABS0S8L6_9HYPH|nr:hypothetical protein [Aquamicrobium zhengzhouense]MBI1619134.1 hypothetical protein [Aquamicrobium zhengzhouense]
MLKYIAFAAVSTCLTFSALPAMAGGWGKSGASQSSYGGFVNISPSVQTGNLALLSGIGVLNNSNILSGNVISGLVKGNNNNVGHGNTTGSQNAVGNGIIGGGSFGNAWSSMQLGKLGRR